MDELTTSIVGIDVLDEGITRSLSEAALTGAAERRLHKSGAIVSETR